MNLVNSAPGRWLKDIVLGCLLTALVPVASANEYSVALGVDIPDNDLSGVASTINVGSDIFSISSVQVTLTVQYGYSGDYYAYLAHDGAIAVLLNRTGRTLSDPFGLSTPEIAVVFDDSAPADVHTCQTTLARRTQDYSVWQPDARNVAPDLSETDTPRSAFLSTFDGLPASGEWTLFIADASPVGTGFIHDWSLTLEGSAVPDPGSTASALALGGAVLHLLRLRTSRFGP